MTKKLDGAERIATERVRQVLDEGYDAQHDKDHAVDLINAASRYLRDVEGLLARGVTSHPGKPTMEDMHGHLVRDWPWLDEDYKPSADPIRTLEKAGALVAAAIDALLPEESVPTKPGSVIRATTPDRPGRQPYFRILDQEDGRNWVALSGKSFSEESFDSWELSS